MSDYFYTVGTDTISSQSSLSSTYSAELSGYLQTSAADYIGYLAYTVNGVTLEDALAIVDAVAAGQFTLADLFSAAQTKTAFADADSFEGSIADAQPKLTVNGVTIDLTAILSDPDVAYWVTTTKKEGSIYHLREFYTAADAPEGYTEGWSDVQVVNVAPEAVEFTAAATEWNIKQGAPVGDAAWMSIDLLDGTTQDADGDAINVVAGSVSVNGTLLGDDSDLYVVDGNTLKINTNSEYFQLLFGGQTTDLSVSYDITDGQGHTVASSGTVTVTGTVDLFGMEGTASGSVTSFNTTTFDGSFSVLIPTSQLVAGADAYTDFSGTATVTAVGDLAGTSETIVFTLEGASGTLTLGGDGANSNGFEPDNPNYSVTTDSGTSTFNSSDTTVGVSYDSATGGGATGVDAMTSITVVLSDVTYWA